MRRVLHGCQEEMGDKSPRALGDTQIRPMGDSKNPANEIENRFVPGEVDRHAFPHLGTPSPNPWDLSLCRQKGSRAECSVGTVK